MKPFLCSLSHYNYLSSVAIRGKLARDKAKRIKEKRLKSDSKPTNTTLQEFAFLVTRGNGSMRLRLHRSVMSSVKYLETKMKHTETAKTQQNIVMLQSGIRPAYNFVCLCVSNRNAISC